MTTEKRLMGRLLKEVEMNLSLEQLSFENVTAQTAARNCNTAASKFTKEDLERLFIDLGKAFGEIERPRVDVIVTTKEAAKNIRSKSSSMIPQETAAVPNTLCGIPFETRDSSTQAIERAAELTKLGFEVMLVMD
jgi:hypothetical protein